jgi:hypothetical protein
MKGVADFTGIGGSLAVEWVAALLWNQWQHSTGIRSPIVSYRIVG